MARSRAPRRRRLFASFSSSTPGGTREALALSRHARSPPRTRGRAPATAARAARARAPPESEDGGSREERKGRGRVTGGGGSCGSRGHERSGESRRRRRRPPGPAAASASPLLGTGAAGAERAGGRATLREPVGARTRRDRPANARRVQPGPEPRPEWAAGGRARRAPRAGEGARAGGTGGGRQNPDLESARAPPRGLHLAARRTLGSGNGRAAARGFPFRVCQTKGTSPGGLEASLYLSPTSPGPSPPPRPLRHHFPLSSSASAPPQVSKGHPMENTAGVSFSRCRLFRIFIMQVPSPQAFSAFGPFYVPSNLSQRASSLQTLRCPSRIIECRDSVLFFHNITKNYPNGHRKVPTPK